MDINVAASTAFGGLIGLPSSGGSSAGVIAARKESKIPGRLRASPEPKLIPTNLPALRGVRFQPARPAGQAQRCDWRKASESEKYLFAPPTYISTTAATVRNAVM